LNVLAHVDFAQPLCHLNTYSGSICG